MGDDGATHRPDIGVPDPDEERGTASPSHPADTPLTGEALRRALHDELPSLLRTATLYLDDQAAAEELTRRTLQECVGPTHALTRGGIRLTLHLWLRALAVARETPPAAAGPRTTTDPVGAAVERLPGDVRAAVHLVDTEGFSYHETARILGVPTSTATALIHAGRDLVSAAVRNGGRPSRHGDDT